MSGTERPPSQGSLVTGENKRQEYWNVGILEEWQEERAIGFGLLSPTIPSFHFSIIP